MPKKATQAAARQMRQLGQRPLLGEALAAGDITGSLALTIADWARQLPAEMRHQTDRIVLEAGAAGASADDLAMIAACAIETWRAQQPDPDEPDPGDRYLRLGTTFGDAGVIRGDLTPECNAAVRAVLEAPGKKAGPEDDGTDGTDGQRFHDALQLACAPLPRVCRLVQLHFCDLAGAVAGSEVACGFLCWYLASDSAPGRRGAWPARPERARSPVKASGRASPPNPRWISGASPARC